MKKIETKYGEVTLKDVVHDVDGTNLVDAVEVELDGEVLGVLPGASFDDGTTAEDAERILEENYL